MTWIESSSTNIHVRYYVSLEGSTGSSFQRPPLLSGHLLALPTLHQNPDTFKITQYLQTQPATHLHPTSLQSANAYGRIPTSESLHTSASIIMISAQDWKTANLVKCADADGIDADHVAAVEALASLLEGHMTPADAAQAITTVYAGSVKMAEGPFKEDSWPSNKVYRFWGVFMSNAIQHFGSAEDQERLFKLLVEISRRPDLEDDDGIVVRDMDLDTYWIDLPDWVDCFSDATLCEWISYVTQSYLLTEYDSLHSSSCEQRSVTC